MGKESMDVGRARERAQAVQSQLEEMEARLQEDIAALEAGFDATTEELEEIRIYPKKTGMTTRLFGLIWMPYRKGDGGRLAPDWAEKTR
jgi:hypothetical protein